MGCLNSGQGFDHWFGNIHFSGPCNKACYFCIGQHMMALDGENNLSEWPLAGMDKFLKSCHSRGVDDVNLTGTNTDPSLYRHLPQLVDHLRDHGFTVGVRTNGIAPLDWGLFDQVSVSFPSHEPAVYEKMMGSGPMPDMDWIARTFRGDLRVNIVLGPENWGSVVETIRWLAHRGVVSINLREPYGQPRLGNPLAGRVSQAGRRFGSPQYNFLEGRRLCNVLYWDVHYVHVESVNLYAGGRVSLDYPVTRGHAPSGQVQGQEHFQRSGRIRQQWVS